MRESEQAPGADPAGCSQLQVLNAPREYKEWDE